MKITWNSAQHLEYDENELPLMSTNFIIVIIFKEIMIVLEWGVDQGQSKIISSTIFILKFSFSLQTLLYCRVR